MTNTRPLHKHFYETYFLHNPSQMSQYCLRSSIQFYIKIKPECITDCCVMFTANYYKYSWMPVTDKGYTIP